MSKDIQVLGDMKVAQSIVRDALGSGRRGINVNIIGQIQVNKDKSDNPHLPDKVDHVSPSLLADILHLLPEPRLDSLHALILKSVRNKFTSKEDCMTYLGVSEKRYNSLSTYTHQRTKSLRDVLTTSQEEFKIE